MKRKKEIILLVMVIVLTIIGVCTCGKSEIVGGIIIFISAMLVIPLTKTAILEK